ncbi:hypothetical protein BD779DRAFT_1575041 [Infundibulicybe gibba]|nr:hypothetical protein BD779DRAFT_1575041 [Infundibulicybe gibba]
MPKLENQKTILSALFKLFRDGVVPNDELNAWSKSFLAVICEYTRLLNGEAPDPDIIHWAVAVKDTIREQLDLDWQEVLLPPSDGWSDVTWSSTYADDPEEEREKEARCARVSEQLLLAANTIARRRAQVRIAVENAMHTQTMMWRLIAELDDKEAQGLM